jgi:hypothetical protein
MIYKFIIIYGIETHIEFRARCQSPGVEKSLRREVPGTGVDYADAWNPSAS